MSSFKTSRILMDKAGRGGSSQPPSTEGIAGKKKRPQVLVVDDEKLVLRATGRMLFRMGYDYRTSRHPREALEMTRDWKPDLLITDFNMGGMNGLELLREVKKICPDIRVIVNSGGIKPEETAEVEREREE